MRLLRKIPIFLKEVSVEMKKVNWPTRKQTAKYTLTVIGISVAVAAYLGILDFIFASLLEKFII